ncbi:MAG: hypothetical protein AB1635_21200 [Acidobacteriota bacterium]
MRTTMATVLLAVLLGAASTLAQAPAVPPDPPEDMSPREVQRLFDAYMIMQAQDALGLSEAQYGQFLARLRGLQETRRRTQDERMRLIGELQRMTNPRAGRLADESVVKDRLNQLQELEGRTAAELRKAYNAIDEVLDVYQQARFRLFEEQFERRKLELLLRARQNNRPNVPPRRPPGLQ